MKKYRPRYRGGKWLAGPDGQKAPPVIEATRVVIDRPAESRVGRRPFARGPAVIAARDGLVDLFPGVLAHVVDEDPAGAGLDGETERIAEAPSPRSRGTCPGPSRAERIVLGDRAVGVESQELALEGRQLLRRRSGGLVADGDVELAVGAEMERTALMPAGDLAAELRLVVAFEEDELAAGGGHVARGREAADAVMGVRPPGHVADVEVAVVGEVGVEGHADQPAPPTCCPRRGSRTARAGALPSLSTRRRPVCSQTKMRPSGAMAIAVAPVIPDAIRSLGEAGREGDRPGDAAAGSRRAGRRGATGGRRSGRRSPRQTARPPGRRASVEAEQGRRSCDVRLGDDATLALASTTLRSRSDSARIRPEKTRPSPVATTSDR